MGSTRNDIPTDRTWHERQFLHLEEHEWPLERLDRHLHGKYVRAGDKMEITLALDFPKPFVDLHCKVTFSFH